MLEYCKVPLRVSKGVLLLYSKQGFKFYDQRYKIKTPTI